MDERELLQYHEKVASWVCFSLGVVFFVVSAMIYSDGETLPLSMRSADVRPTEAQMHAAVQYETLSGAWNFLSLSNVVVFASLLIGSVLLLMGGEGIERMVEEMRLVNLIMVLLSLGIISISMLIWGNQILSERKMNGLGVGMLYGGAKYFAALLMMVCLLFASPILDEREQREGIWIAPSTSFACLVLTVLHFAFSMKARSVVVAVYDAENDPASVMDSQLGIGHSIGGDFVHIDESGRVVSIS